VDAAQQEEPRQAGADAEHSRKPEQERIDVLEAENADARQQIAEANQKIADTDQKITNLQAKNDELGKSFTDLQARLERLEHASQAEPSTDVTDREDDAAKRDGSKADAQQLQRRHLPSDEALALGAATAGGVITTVSDYVPFLHADMAGMAASVVAVGAATLTWMRARREAKHAHQSKD
jgi:chromosome segregation ATPase